MKKYLPFALGLAIFASASATPVLAQTIYHRGAGAEVMNPVQGIHPNPVPTTGAGWNMKMHDLGSYTAEQ
jgi:hypothetical protein